MSILSVSGITLSIQQQDILQLEVEQGDGQQAVAPLVGVGEEAVGPEAQAATAGREGDVSEQAEERWWWCWMPSSMTEAYAARVSARRREWHARMRRPMLTPILRLLRCLH